MQAPEETETREFCTLLAATESRKIAERNAQLVENRIRLLRLEEEKAMKRVQRMNERTELAAKRREEKAAMSAISDAMFHASGTLGTRTLVHSPGQFARPRDAPILLYESGCSRSRSYKGDASPALRSRVSDMRASNALASSAAKDAYAQGVAERAAAMRALAGEGRARRAATLAASAARACSIRDSIRRDADQSRAAREELAARRAAGTREQAEAKLSGELEGERVAREKLASLELVQAECVSRLREAQRAQAEAYDALTAAAGTVSSPMISVSLPADGQQANFLTVAGLGAVPVIRAGVGSGMSFTTSWQAGGRHAQEQESSEPNFYTVSGGERNDEGEMCATAPETAGAIPAFEGDVE